MKIERKASGSWLLATGCWLLATGSLQLDTGGLLFATGCWQQADSISKVKNCH